MAKEYYGNWIFYNGKRNAVISYDPLSFLTGAGISAALLIFNHNFCERILYFIEYVKCTVGTGKISSYRRKNIAAPENFHFTIPVFISVLLYAGGIY